MLNVRIDFVLLDAGGSGQAKTEWVARAQDFELLGPAASSEPCLLCNDR